MTKINEKWLLASVIGTVWASSEIVLGSFLHNLKVPFSGTFLTSIGVIILISFNYRYKLKGVFWRAGLICALLKTMSPSAIIFGPMIAIFTESLLIEVSVRIFGINKIGFLIGSILAVSWTLVQKILNLIILYGFNIIKIYKDVVIYAQKQIRFETENIWMPIFLLLVIQLIIGIISAIVGIRAGMKIENQTVKKIETITKPISKPKTPKQNQQFTKYSVFHLFLNIAILISSIIVISLADWKIWSVLIILVIIFWISRYKRALKQISRPKFWLFFFLITMITVFVFSNLSSNPLSFSEAMLIGLEMNSRATILILGFSTIGAELYNPKIKDFFKKTHFNQLQIALEMSVESLPSVLSNIPDARTILKNPSSVVYQFVQFSEERIKKFQKENHFPQKIIFITGKINSGKTTVLKKIIDILKSKNFDLKGFYSEKILEENTVLGYDLVNVSTLRKMKFLRRTKGDTSEKIGSYSIDKQGLEYGVKTLENIDDKTDFAIIDEVGFYELNDKGWAESLRNLKKLNKTSLIVVSRIDFLDKVIKKFEIYDYQIFNVEKDNFNKIENYLF